uniref:D-isomer specific 2-hydroxyacid dehydrogenase NAD-binding domain-containing protein n=1 Tax=Opuntia streptacantha TaxID=393608 RepID=A0A7C9ABQ5_OPUST
MEVCGVPAAQFPATPTGLCRKLRAWKLPTIRTLHPLASQASHTNLQCQIDGHNSNHSSNRMFILGMGYVGQFFAQQLMNDGWSVSGTCKSIKKKKELEQKGFDAHVFDACQPEWKILDVLRCHTHLFISIPPVEGIGDPLLQHEEHLKSKLVDGDLQWLCYLSSTSMCLKCFTFGYIDITWK